MAGRPGQLVGHPSRFKPWLAFCVVLGSLAAGSYAGGILANTATQQTATAEVQALVDRGSLFRLYYNNTWSEPQADAIEAGQWTTYRFSVPSRLTALRLDPAEASNAHILVKSVTVRANGSSTVIPLDALAQWLKSDLDATYDESADALEITTRGRAAYMMGTVDVDLTRQTHPLLRHFRLNPTTLLWCVFIAGLAAMVLSTAPGDLPLALAAGGGGGLAVLLGYMVAPYALGWPPLPTDVSAAIGHEAFFGRSKAGELRAMNAAATAAAVTALLVGSVLRRAKEPSRTASLPQARWRVRDALFVGTCALILAAGAVPAATDLQQAALAPRLPDDFDGLNMLVWQYLHATGALPWRDYWFPYSGTYDMLAPLHPEIAIGWSHAILLATIMLTTGFLAVRHSWMALSALLTVWAYLTGVGALMATAAARYFLSVSVVMVAAVAMSQRNRWTAIGFGAWTFYVFQEEVSQIAYAAPAVLLLAVAGLVCGAPHSDRLALLRRMLLAAAVFLVCLTIYVLSFLWRGQLAQWLEFIATMDVMSAYSGWPADIETWFMPPATLDQFLVFITIVLLVGGMLQAAWSRFRNLYLLLPVCLGLVSLMMLQKQVIRPGIERQILATPVLGFALLVTQQLQGRRLPMRCLSWIAGSAALLVTCFTLSVESERMKMATFVDVTTELLPDVQRTLVADATWRQGRERYFSPQSFKLAGLSGEDFARRVEALTHIAKEDEVYVLGDRSSIYLALRRPVPFYISLYNQSPLSSQRTTLKWLNAHNPKFLFWDPREQSFDGVPNPVRTPLIYNYVIDRFIPIGAIGPYEVLRRREPHEPAAIDYWRTHLGTSIDLGYIPSASQALTDAEANGAYRMSYLIARVERPEEARTYRVHLRLAGRPYSILFKGRAGVTNYPIALDRLPFSSAGHSMDCPVSIVSTDMDVTAELKVIALTRERLY